MTFDVLTLAGLFLAILVTEFVILYASTALGNVDINLGKWLLASFLAAVVWAALSYGGLRLIQAGTTAQAGPFAPENRALLLGVTGGALLASWVVLSFAFVPVFPTSVQRGMLVSIFQLLLRLFLYVLIAAVVMVVLAVLQIRSGPATPEKAPRRGGSPRGVLDSGMILEAIVTTRSLRGAVNIAPMGPLLSAPYVLQPGTRFTLRPFQTSTTYANLTEHPEGVLHVHDDVLLLARAAVGKVETPTVFPAEVISGEVLADACRAYEFRVVERDDSTPRVRLTAEVVHVHWLRDFFGFNRAMNAVLEAAILATRTALLPRDEVESEYRRLAVIVDKTAGPREREAFAVLQAHVAASYDAAGQTGS